MAHYTEILIVILMVIKSESWWRYQNCASIPFSEHWGICDKGDEGVTGKFIQDAEMSLRSPRVRRIQNHGFDLYIIWRQWMSIMLM